MYPIKNVVYRIKLASNGNNINISSLFYTYMVITITPPVYKVHVSEWSIKIQFTVQSVVAFPMKRITRCMEFLNLLTVRIYVQNVLKAFYLRYPSFIVFKPFREQFFLLQCVYIKINFNIWRKWRGYVATFFREIMHVDFFFQSAY